MEIRPINRPSVVILTPDRQVDRRILLQAESLQKANWQVTIIAMPLDEPATEKNSLVQRLPSHPQTITRERVILNAYRWFRQYLPMNGRVMRFLKQFTWKYLEDPEIFYLKLFAEAVSPLSPTVFLAADLPMLAVARQAAERSGAKLIYDSHELYAEQDFSTGLKRRWREIENKHIQACDAVITINPSIADELSNRYAIKNVHVIYNAEKKVESITPTRAFHEKFQLPHTRKILLYQGGLSAGRHLETLVASLQFVKNPEVVLVVLGEGQLRQTLEQQACDKVYFHPAVPQAELLNYTQAADAGIIPYQATCLNNRYCTPNKLFEYIAAGIPILASDLPEIRKIVMGEAIGWVADLSTTHNIAKNIDSFFQDPELLNTRRTQLSDVRQKICWEQEEIKLLKIFEEFR